MINTKIFIIYSRLNYMALRDNSIYVVVLIIGVIIGVVGRGFYTTDGAGSEPVLVEKHPFC